MAYAAQSRNVIRHVVYRGTAFNKSENAIHHPLFFACQGVRYRKLEVILTTGIEKLGKAGETVKVAPGLFRNHLMPKLLAVPNIDKYAYLIREQRKMYKHEEDQEEVKVVHKTSEGQTKEYEKAAKRLANANLVLRKLIDKEKFKNRSSKDDKPDVRTPVTKEEIVSEVARQLCVKIDPDNVVLPTPLETFGEYEVPLKFPKTISLPQGTVQWILKVKNHLFTLLKRRFHSAATDAPSETLRKKIADIQNSKKRRNPTKNQFLVEVPESRSYLDTATMPMFLAVVGIALFAKVLMMIDDSKSQEMIERKIKNAPPGQGTVRMLEREEWDEFREVRPRTPFESKLARPNAQIRSGEPVRKEDLKNWTIDVLTDALSRTEEIVRRGSS